MDQFLEATRRSNPFQQTEQKYPKFMVVINPYKFVEKVVPKVDPRPRTTKKFASKETKSS
jgi:hypothetical protein